MHRLIRRVSTSNAERLETVDGTHGRMHHRYGPQGTGVAASW